MRPVFLRSFRAISLIGLFSVIAGGIAFTAQILLARAWTPTEYGAFATAYATISLLTPLAGFGVGLWWLQIFAEEGRTGARWLRPSLGFVLLTTAMVTAVLVLWALVSSDGLLRSLLLLLTTAVFVHASAGLLKSKFLLEERYTAVAVIQTLPKSGKLLIGLLAVLVGFDPVAATTIYAGFAAIVLGFSVRTFIELFRKGPRLPTSEASYPRPEISASLPNLARQVAPYGIGGLLYMVLYQSDIVLLGNMRTEESAAVYSVCVTLISAFYLFPSAVFQKYLIPKLHRWANHQQERFLAVYRFGTSVMAVSGIGAMLTILLVGPWLVELLFGSAYGSTRLLLSILSLTLPIRYMAASVGGALTAAGEMGNKAKTQGATAVANIGLNLALIPVFGVYAAAGTSVVCELLQLVAFLFIVREQIFGGEGLHGWNLKPSTMLVVGAGATKTENIDEG